MVWDQTRLLAMADIIVVEANLTGLCLGKKDSCANTPQGYVEGFRVLYTAAKANFVARQVRNQPYYGVVACGNNGARSISGCPIKIRTVASCCPYSLAICCTSCCFCYQKKLNNIGRLLAGAH